MSFTYATGKMPIVIVVDDETNVPRYAQTDTEQRFPFELDTTLITSSDADTYCAYGITRTGFENCADLFVRFENGKWNFGLQAVRLDKDGDMVDCGMSHKPTSKTITVIRQKRFKIKRNCK
jgi:hypothetical protein